MTSSLKEIYIGPERMGPMESVSSVAAITGRGLKGDRYEAGTGSYSNSAGFRDVTLIEMEALWGLLGRTGIDLHPSFTRRNFVTEGVSLNSLVGSIFSIGEVTLLGLRLCPPCAHLAKLLAMPEVLKGLAHSGGIYARIINGGRLEVGDELVPSMLCSVDDKLSCAKYKSYAEQSVSPKSDRAGG